MEEVVRAAAWFEKACSPCLFFIFVLQTVEDSTTLTAGEALQPQMRVNSMEGTQVTEAENFCLVVESLEGPFSHL